MKTRIILCSLVSFLCLAAARGAEDAVWKKLEDWKVPLVDFKLMELGDAVAWVRAKSRKIDPVGKGRNAGILLGYERRRSQDPDRLITLHAENIFFGDLLTEIGKQANRTVEIHEDGVVLRMPGAIPVAEGMVERTYRAPFGFFDLIRRLNEGADVDPFGVGAGDLNEEVRPQSTREILEGYGITFEEGASARRMNSSTGKLLVVTNTPDQLELVEAIMDSIMDGGYPRQLRIQAEIYATETAKALGLARDADNPAGATLLLRDLGAMVAAGEAELVGCPMIVTRSGQRAKIENGWSRDLVTGYTVEDGKDRATTKRVTSGVTLEVDPVIGADSRTIELNIALDIATGEPTVTSTEILAPASGKPVVIEEVETRGSWVQTAITTLSGQPQWLGIIPPQAGSDQAMLVIVTATVLEVRESFPVTE
jgi:hypothetical protein